LFNGRFTVVHDFSGVYQHHSLVDCCRQRENFCSVCIMLVWVCWMLSAYVLHFRQRADKCKEWKEM